MQKLQAIRIQDVKTASWHEYDPWLVVVVIFLLAAGVVMVASSSVALAERLHQDSFYYLQRQVLALLVGLAFAAFIMKSPVTLWEKLGTPLLLLAILLLVLVLIPGIGREVNGSARWIRIGPVNFQSSGTGQGVHHYLYRRLPGAPRRASAPDLYRFFAAHRRHHPDLGPVVAGAGLRYGRRHFPDHDRHAVHGRYPGKQVFSVGTGNNGRIGLAGNILTVPPGKVEGVYEPVG